MTRSHVHKHLSMFFLIHLERETRPAHSPPRAGAVQQPHRDHDPHEPEDVGELATRNPPGQGDQYCPLTGAYRNNGAEALFQYLMDPGRAGSHQGTSKRLGLHLVRRNNNSNIIEQ